MDFRKRLSNIWKMLSVTIFCFLVICTCVNSDSNESNQCLQKQSDTFSDIISSLNSRLINEIGKEENFIISPLSISAALAMLYIGAGGSTKTQIANALDYNITDNKCPDMKILDGFRDLFQSLAVDNDNISVIVANSVFIQTGFTVSPDYIFKVKEFFDSEINYENFLYEEEAAMININKWVANKTKSQIKNLLNEPLDTMTLMVLTNVIYFKGRWVYPFTNTWNSYFHPVNGVSKAIPFMKMEEDLNYYHDDVTKHSFLELPYDGGNISMLLILPVGGNKLIPDFQLNSRVLCNLRSKLENKRVMVGLPKVQLGYSRELSKDMSKFGMTQLFSDRADLTGIREQNDLHVSLMIHKAVIEINEEGSRASVISGIGIDSRKRPTHEAIFWANHPFQFYIIDARKETILFAGRVVNP